MVQCFSIKLVVSSPPELMSKLPQMLKELKKKLSELEECCCSGGSYLYVCACHGTLLKTMLVQAYNAPVLKEGGLPGGPAVEMTLESRDPQDLVHVLNMILEVTREYNLPYTFVG